MPPPRGTGPVTAYLAIFLRFRTLNCGQVIDRQKLLFDAFIYLHFAFKFHFFTFNFCELLNKQSKELQIIVASDVNREYNNKHPCYPCVCRKVPNIFSIKITNIPTNNTNIVNYGQQKNLNWQYLLVSDNI